MVLMLVVSYRWGARTSAWWEGLMLIGLTLCLQRWVYDPLRRV
jgi:hypothetical protein